MSVKTKYPAGSIDATRYADGALHLERAPLIKVGPPSTGKTEGNRTTAEALLGGTDGHYLEVKGAWLNRPEILLGLPTVQMINDVPLTTLTPNAMFLKLVDEPGYLNMDEVNQCPPDGMGALMALFLERKAGFLNLHPDCWITGAMNPSKMGTATRRMGWALASRLCQLWIEPSAKELAELHRQGYPVIPLNSDQSLRDRFFRQLDGIMVTFWSEVPGSILSEEPGGWMGEPIPTSRGWRGAIGALARLRAMPDQGCIMPNMDYHRARMDAEALVVGSFVGPIMAQTFLTFERRVSKVAPLDVLSGRELPPKGLSGAEAAAWLNGLADAVLDDGNLWWDGRRNALGDALPALIDAFGADLLVQSIGRVARGARDCHQKKTPGWDTYFQGRQSFAVSMSASGFKDYTDQTGA